MRRGLQTDKGKLIVERAEGRILKGERRDTVMGAGIGGDVASMGDVSITDPDGNLYIMCGVSVCGGTDVAGP